MSKRKPDPSSQSCERQIIHSAWNPRRAVPSSRLRICSCRFMMSRPTFPEQILSNAESNKSSRASKSPYSAKSSNLEVCDSTLSICLFSMTFRSPTPSGLPPFGVLPKTNVGGALVSLPPVARPAKVTKLLDGVGANVVVRGVGGRESGCWSVWVVVNVAVAVSSCCSVCDSAVACKSLTSATSSATFVAKHLQESLQKVGLFLHSIL